MVIFVCFYGPMYSMLGTYKEGNGGSDVDNLGCRDGDGDGCVVVALGGNYLKS